MKRRMIGAWMALMITASSLVVSASPAADMSSVSADPQQEQTEPERAEAEQVEAEIVYAPMVAETHEYQYNADAFEARGVDEVKHEAAHKEVSKVREDKAR